VTGSRPHPRLLTLWVTANADFIHHRAKKRNI
jgi:hypothetical protein